MSEPTVSELKDEIKSLHRWVGELSHKLSQVLGNQRHYLRARAPLVIRNQRKKIIEATRMLAKFERIPNIRVTTSYGGAKRKRRSIFMCTGNEARKLRKMADLDLRFLNGARVSLARQRNK